MQRIHDDDFNPVPWLLAIFFFGIAVGVLWPVLKPALDRLFG